MRTRHDNTPAHSWIRNSVLWHSALRSVSNPRHTNFLPILLLAKLEICLEKGRPAQDGSGEHHAALPFAWNIAPTDAKVAVTSTRGPQAHGQHTSPVPGKGEDILAGSTRWRTPFPDEVRAHPR